MHSSLLSKFPLSIFSPIDKPPHPLLLNFNSKWVSYGRMSYLSDSNELHS